MSNAPPPPIDVAALLKRVGEFREKELGPSAGPDSLRARSLNMVMKRVGVSEFRVCRRTNVPWQENAIAGVGCELKDALIIAATGMGKMKVLQGIALLRRGVQFHFAPLTSLIQETERSYKGER